MGGKAERLRSKNISNIRSHRIVAKATPIRHEPNPGTIATNDADTNADTCCLGSNFIPINQSNRSAGVHPYSDEYRPIKNIPIVFAATAFDQPDGNTYILVFNECLYFGTRMKHSLINPNQIRWNGLHFQDNPTDDLFIEMGEDLTIPLRYEGTKNREPRPNTSWFIVNITI